MTVNIPLAGTLAKKQLSSKSEVVGCAKLFQLFEVDNSLPVLNAGCFASAILGFPISHARAAVAGLKSLHMYHNVNLLTSASTTLAQKVVEGFWLPVARVIQFRKFSIIHTN